MTHCVCVCNNVVVVVGAHSHIRGLGLDDALAPRPVGVVSV